MQQYEHQLRAYEKQVELQRELQTEMARHQEQVGGAPGAVSYGAPPQQPQQPPPVPMMAQERRGNSYVPPATSLGSSYYMPPPPPPQPLATANSTYAVPNSYGSNYAAVPSTTAYGAPYAAPTTAYAAPTTAYAAAP